MTFSRQPRKKERGVWGFIHQPVMGECGSLECWVIVGTKGLGWRGRYSGPTAARVAAQPPRAHLWQSATGRHCPGSFAWGIPMHPVQLVVSLLFMLPLFWSVERTGVMADRTLQPEYSAIGSQIKIRILGNETPEPGFYWVVRIILRKGSNTLPDIWEVGV